MKKVSVFDKIEEFKPSSHEVRYVILGTMASSDARWINGKDPGDVFYYNNPRNHFWRILSWIADGCSGEIKSPPVKKSFLEDHGIAMVNLVEKIEVPEKDSENPADLILFKAFLDNPKQLAVKSVSQDFKELLRSKPVFFTCLEKKGITDLLEDFYLHNDLDVALIKKIKFLPSPTRCSPEKRSRRWINEGLNIKK